MFSFCVLMGLAGLVMACWHELSLDACAFDRNGVPKFLTELEGSGGTARVSPLKCHLMDVLVWIYVVGFFLLMVLRFVDYRAPSTPTSGEKQRISYLYFFADYCYLHNLVACLLLVGVTLDLRRGDGASLLGSLKKPVAAETVHSRAVAFFLPGVPLSAFGVHFSIVPLSVGIAELTSTARLAATAIFGAILSGNSVILVAIKIWNNALVLHDRDKLVSVWIHLALPTVTALLLHSTMQSFKHRSKSESRDALYASVQYWWLLASHFAMFALWQVLRESFLFWRRRVHAARAQDDIVRIDSYAWMIDKPPGGKASPLYRFATLLGPPGSAGSKVCFIILQGGIHLLSVTIGAVPIYASVYLLDAWPLLVFSLLFMLLAVRNGAMVLKRWIQKLEEKAAIGEAALAAGFAMPGERAKSSSPDEKKKKK